MFEMLKGIGLPSEQSSPSSSHMGWYIFSKEPTPDASWRLAAVRRPIELRYPKRSSGYG